MCDCLLWLKHLHQPRSVTGESQRQSETPAGVNLAAKNAHINMLQSQLDEAAKQIAALKNKPPETIIQTVPYEVEKVVIREVLKEIAKLPATTPVTLNQYNVFAYKKII